jgi:fatty-acyl-CoA synthase
MLKAKAGINLLFGMPLFHVGGSLTQVLTTLSAGGCLVVLSPAGWRNPSSVKNIWRLVERFKPEVLSSVPTVLAAALAIPPGKRRPVEPEVCSWRRIGDPGGGRQRDPGKTQASGL